MGINVTLNTIGNLQDTTTAQTQLNTNNAAIQTGFSSALNTAGDKMLGNLDMNSNQILNLPPPATINSPVRLQDITASGITLTVPSVGTSGAVVGLLNTNKTDSGNNTFTGTNSFATISSPNLAFTNTSNTWSGTQTFTTVAASTITVTTGTISSLVSNTATVSTLVATSISTPSITGCFGGFRADMGNTAALYTTPSPNNYYLIPFNNLQFTSGAPNIFNTTTNAFTPPPGTKLVFLDGTVEAYTLSSSAPAQTTAVKWIKNGSNSGGFQGAGGTAMMAGVGSAAEGGTPTLAASAIFHASGWDAPTSSSDYYQLFIFYDTGTTNTAVTIDGNVSHTYISGFYFQ